MPPLQQCVPEYQRNQPLGFAGLDNDGAWFSVAGVGVDSSSAYGGVDSFFRAEDDGTQVSLHYESGTTSNANTVTFTASATAGIVIAATAGVVISNIGSLNGISATELSYLDNATSNIQAQIDLKAPISSPTFTGTVSGITKAMVGLGNVVDSLQLVAANNLSDLVSASTARTNIGLGNVDNTSDANKPISSATATALSDKADLVGGLVPSAQLPSFVDDVLEYANFAALPGTGASEKIYVTLDDNKTYRWSGSAYVEISASLALGETSSTAYRGDRGKIAYDHSLLTAGNPHAVTKSEVGLGNADNTSDANKPVSTAQATAIAVIQSDINAHEALTNNPHAVTKSQVGLGNVGNVLQLEAAANLGDLGSASVARVNLILGTSDSPQFAGVNVGHASDTTITRAAAGALAIEGKIIGEPSAALVGSYHLLTGNPSSARWHHSWLSSFTTTSANFAGGLEATFVGTATTPAITTTSLRTSRPRLVITGAASAGSVAHIRSAVRHVTWRGNAAGLGGFYFVSVVGVQTAIAGSIYMIGLMEAAAFVGATTEASANVDAVFLGWDSGDTNCQIMHNDVADDCTKVDLGANFPARTANCIFRLFLFAEPNGSAIYYQVDRLDSAFSASGSISTNLPTNSTLLRLNHYESNNATATAPVLNHYRTDIWQPWQ